LLLAFIHLRFEVVNADLVEIAEDDVAGAIGDQTGPVVECLAVMALEVSAALLHFKQNDGFPDEVGEGDAAAVFGRLADAKFRLAADVENAGMAEGLEEAVEEDLGLAFLIATDMAAHPTNEFSESFLT
jgi:hypothetical protein